MSALLGRHDVPAHPLAPMVQKLGKWQRLDRDDEQAILDLPFTLHSLPLSGYVVREGDRPQHSCLVISGYTIRHKVVGDGGRQLLALDMRGDLVDLHNSLLNAADYNVQALSALDIARIPREAIVALAYQRPAIGRAMWHDTLVDGSVQREWTANLGRRDARSRIAHLLCEFGVRLEAAGLGTTCEYEMPMTQEQLADSTGLSTVHVNRMLMALDSDGLLRRSKRSVVILDWKRLAATGDFNARYLHLRSDGIEAARTN